MLALTLLCAALTAAPARVGQHAPPIELPDANGHRWSLQDSLKTGPVAIIFYRGFW